LGQLQGGADAAGNWRLGALLELADGEVQSLKAELALHQREMDAVQARVASIESDALVLAESIRGRGEEQAREIIRRAKANADLLVLRAHVQAEETRAREVARLWSRLDAALEAAMDRGMGGDDAAIVQIVTQAPPQADQRAAPEDGAGVPASVTEFPTSVEVADSPQPDDEDEAAILEPVADLAPTAAATDEVDTDPDEQLSQLDYQGEDTEGEPGNDAASEEPSMTLESQEVSDSEGDSTAESIEPDTSLEPGVQRYRVRGPISFASMVAIEQAAGRLPGVSSATATPTPNGGAILTVVTRDPNGAQLDLRQIPHLSWQLEEL
jgi:hypothetical protein